jgi:hypothetical protein
MNQACPPAPVLLLLCPALLMETQTSLLCTANQPAALATAMLSLL